LVSSHKILPPGLRASAFDMAAVMSVQGGGGSCGSAAPKAVSANPLAEPKLGGWGGPAGAAAAAVGSGKWEASSSQNLSAYEKKMMKRLERANRQAAYEAAGVPLPGAKRQEEQRSLPPPPAEGPDHERLAQLAQEARGNGNMFFYFPAAGEQLKNDAACLDMFMKEEETEDEVLRERKQNCPEKGVCEFFERLEDLQQEQRRRQIELGEVEDPWKRAAATPAPPAATSAGRPHEVVIENGEGDDEQEEKSGGAGCGEAGREDAAAESERPDDLPNQGSSVDGPQLTKPADGAVKQPGCGGGPNSKISSLALSAPDRTSK